MAPRENVPEFDDEYGDDDGDLAGAGSLLSIKIRNKRLGNPTVAVRPRTMSETLIDHWKAMKAQKGWVDQTDFSTAELSGIWNHCFEFEPDYRSKTFRIKRIGRILDGVAGLAETGYSPEQNDVMGQMPELAGMLIDWLKTLAADSFEAREPISERETFPIQSGSIAYSCTVAPLTDRQFAPVSVIGLIESVEGRSNQRGLQR